MDGYSLTDKMRRARRRFRFTAVEQALFHELVAICNGEDWRDVFDCSNSELCCALNVNEKTLTKAREALINSGLVYYQQGKSRRSVSRYSFTVPFKTTVKNTVDTSTFEGGDTPTVTTAFEGGVTIIYKTKTKTEKEIIDEFENFRKFYPGTKRGLKTEFGDFSKKHSDYREAIFLLLPALKGLIHWRNQKRELGQFVPEMPHLKTWLSQRRWEQELEKINSDETEKKPIVVD